MNKKQITEMITGHCASVASTQDNGLVATKVYIDDLADELANLFSIHGVIPSVIKKGFAQAMDGETLLVNTQNDELIQINIKDKKTRWDLYCKYLKVTIEVVDETELD